LNQCEGTGMFEEPWPGRSAAIHEKPRFELYLLGQVTLRHQGDRVRLPHAAERVLAFLALHGKWAKRGYLAGTLWSGTTEAHAHANLRSALWKLKALAPSAIEAARDEVRLAPEVAVDFHRSSVAARAVLDESPEGAAEELVHGGLWDEVLPGWYEDWVVLKRELHEQLVLLALEALAERCSARGEASTAILAALTAVEREPLRESAQRALVHAYLVSGNVAEAFRRYQAYERMLWESLRICPSFEVEALTAR
jgi:DNA-binding SARP family transcriptional activator